MVHINLLPVREIKRRARAKQQIVALILAIVCLLAVLGIVGFLQSSKAGQMQQELKKIQKEEKKYSKILKEIKRLEEDKKLLETRISIIGRLKAESSLTVHMLDEVAKITPSKRMWLTSLSQSGNNLNIAGMALDNRTIAKYMEDLKKSPFIRDVNLADSSLKGFAGRNLKSFSLSCSIGVPVKKKKSEQN